MSVFRRRVYERIGGFDEAMRTNEDYDYWLRAAVAGFRFCPQRPAARPVSAARRQPVGERRAHAARHPARVSRTAAACFAGRPVRSAVLDRQVARFEAELPGRRGARRDRTIAISRPRATNLGALHARRGGALAALARLMARWTPGAARRAPTALRRDRDACIGAHPGGPS